MSGNAFIKRRQREVAGADGGEMSEHHYFRRFAYCDSGMIPWLLVAQILSESGQPLSRLVGGRIRLVPVSGALHDRGPDANATIAAFESQYAARAATRDRTDRDSDEVGDSRDRSGPATPR